MEKLLQKPNRPSWQLITAPQHCHTHHNQIIAGDLAVMIHSNIITHIDTALRSFTVVHVQPADQGSHVSN